MIIVEWAKGSPFGRGRVLGWSPDGAGKVCAVVLVDGGTGTVRSVPLLALTVIEDTSKASRRLLKRVQRAVRNAEKLAAAAEIHAVVNGAKSGG